MPGNFVYALSLCTNTSLLITQIESSFIKGPPKTIQMLNNIQRERYSAKFN